MKMKMEKEKATLVSSCSAGAHEGVSKRSIFKRRMLILGDGQLASDLYYSFKGGWSTIDVVGFIVGEPGHMNGDEFCMFETYDNLLEVVQGYSVDIIAVCVEDRRSVLPIQALLNCKTIGIEVVDGHEIYEKKLGCLSIDQLRPSALVFSIGFRRRVLAAAVKRSIDITVALCGLVCLAPLLMVVGILIKLDSPGPVFYRQMRVGLRGQPYMIWKFRSMHNHAERSGPRWAEIKDPRISRVGRFLRRLRIDELPQLYNVLRGEMSLVGPRPERPVFVKELRKKIPYYDIRHTVRPGLSGWAQTQFRYGASVKDSHMKLRYDLYYVKNMSLLLDLRILIKTIKVVLLSEGAR